MALLETPLKAVNICMLTCKINAGDYSIGLSAGTNNFSCSARFFVLDCQRAEKFSLLEIFAWLTKS
jgi:hypothetical protein